MGISRGIGISIDLRVNVKRERNGERMILKRKSGGI